MFRSQQIARLLLEKEELDDCLLSDDHSEWYCIDRYVTEITIQMKKRQISLMDSELIVNRGKRMEMCQLL